MTVVTIQTGTMDEIAGVAVGSGNVWVRPGTGERLSVRLAVGEHHLVVVEGEVVEIGGRRCTLERIEPIEHLGAHRLHFRLDAGGRETAADPAGSAEPPGSAEPAAGGSAPVSTVGGGREKGGGDRRAVTSRPRPAPIGRGQATRLREATGEVLALLGVADADASVGANAGAAEVGPTERWVRTEHEHHVEIDGARCGPNTEVTWAWSAPRSASGASGPRAEIRLSTTRWNPDEISHVAASGYWSDGRRSVHAHLDGPGGAPATELTVSGPPELVPVIGALLIPRLAGDDPVGPDVR